MEPYGTSESRKSRGTRVLVADRHVLFCQGTTELLRTAAGIAEVSWATTIEEAAQVAEQHRPDVVLFDPALGNCDPLGAAESLRNGGGEQFLFLDDRVRPLHVRIALEAEAIGYWTKHASPAEIVFALRQAAAGRPTFCAEVRPWIVEEPMGWRLNPEAQVGLLGSLSVRELEVLLLLVRGKTAQECADRLRIQASTIDNHKARLMKKLGARRSSDLIWLLIREGLLCN